MFQIMIVIRNLLDACGISYTDKQLAKLEKLLHELLKKLSLQQFDSNETTQQHDSISDSEDKSRNGDFASETELKPMEEFDFKPETYYNNTINEEIHSNMHTYIFICQLMGQIPPL